MNTGKKNALSFKGSSKLPKGGIALMPAFTSQPPRPQPTSRVACPRAIKLTSPLSSPLSTHWPLFQGSKNLTRDSSEAILKS